MNIQIVPILYKVHDIRPLMRAALYPVMDRVERAFRDDFALTYATWDNKPKWERFDGMTSKGWVRAYYTYDKVYCILTRGSPPHPIPKNPGRPLVFQWGGPGSYRAKTSPGVLGSTSGGATGGMVVRKSVNHPGFPAREFDTVVANRWKPIFAKWVQEAITNALKS